MLEQNQHQSERKFSLSKLFPNIITLTSICCGLSSIRFALNNQWEVAVSLIIIAGFLDLVDGRVARFLKATSSFGAYLDSLADFINFGVAPGLVIYLWNMSNDSDTGLGWACVLLFAVCMSIRLARFNNEPIDEKKDAWKTIFFQGIPAPAGAYLLLMPMMLHFSLNIEIDNINYILSAYSIFLALMLASTIPTFSTKKIVITRDYVPLFFVIVGFTVAIVIIQPWIALPIFGSIYLLSIPVSIIKYRKLRRMNEISQVST
jgi:CDP-diacylglycerol--serine O-phosphatidyltransferase